MSINKNNNFKQYNKVFFSGIGGCGMSGLAMLFLKDGFDIGGSNLESNIFTSMLEKNGVKISYEQPAENITTEIDLLIYTSAIKDDHPERTKARELGIKEISYFEALALFSTDYGQVIAISGNKGKTTSTAMIASVLKAAGLPVTSVVGSLVTDWQANFLYHEQKVFFVVEACEHMEHMKLFHPDIMVVTNVEAEHLDYYRDLEHIKNSFSEWIKNLKPNGVLIKNVDDKNSDGLSAGNVINLSLSGKGNINAENINVKNGRQFFTVENIGEMSLNFPGEYNVMNGLTAIAIANYLRIDKEIVKKTISDFAGTWRRFELIGEINGAKVFSDYAHNPLSLNGLFAGIKELYPNTRIVAIFQPHQHARTKLLYNEFIAALKNNIDVLVIQKIYDVAGREETRYADVNSRKLVDDLKQHYFDRKIFYSDSNEESLKILQGEAREGDLVLVVGAGDVDGIRELI